MYICKWVLQYSYTYSLRRVSFPVHLLMKVLISTAILHLLLVLLLLELPWVVVLRLMVVVNLTIIIGVYIEMHITWLLLFVPLGANIKLNVYLFILTAVMTILRYWHLLVLWIISETIILVGVALHETAGIHLFLFLILL